MQARQIQKLPFSSAPILTDRCVYFQAYSSHTQHNRQVWSPLKETTQPVSFLYSQSPAYLELFCNTVFMTCILGVNSIVRKCIQNRKQVKTVFSYITFPAHMSKTMQILHRTCYEVPQFDSVNWTSCWPQVSAQKRQQNTSFSNALRDRAQYCSITFSSSRNTGSGSSGSQLLIPASTDCLY